MLCAPGPFVESHADSRRKSRQGDQLRQRAMPAALPASKHQDQTGETRLRMNIDGCEIDRLYLAAAVAIDLDPAIAGSKRGADRRRPIVRQPLIPDFDDRRAALPL